MIDNKMNDQNITVELAQAEVAHMEEIVTAIKTQLEEEKSQEKPEREQLEQKLAEAIKDVRATLSELDHHKAAAKKRKKEIDEWKRWYYALSDIDKSADMAKLQAETNWRSREIGQLEAEIEKLNKQILLDQGRVEQLKQQLHALDGGFWELPIEADPRLLAAKRALVEALKRVETFL